MLVFGHTGITLGAAILLTGMRGSIHFKKTAESEVAQLSPSTLKNIKAPTGLLSHRLAWLGSLGRRVDIRVLLIGSLLPDIIDKPIGQVFFRETLSNGRIFSHTLLFLMLIAIAGIYFYRRNGRTWLLVLSFGTFMHLILDQMWRTPRTLLWPLFGFAFERADITNWIFNKWHALFTNPAVYVPELVGILILISFVCVLLTMKKMYVFMRYGQIH